MTITDTRQTQAGRSLIEPPLFDQLARRVAADSNLDAPTAERILDQALAFLAASAVTTARLSPSALVDYGWHAFILHTREYAEFCDRVAGRFIHHVPTDGEHDDVGAAGPWETTKAIVAAGYVVDAPLWEDAARCSQCHNGCHNDPPPNPGFV